jgi:hypothetical protein
LAAAPAGAATGYVAQAGQTLAAPYTNWASAASNVREVVFTPYVSGPNTNIDWFGWDFTNSGVYNLTGAGLPTVTNIYPEYGAYPVRLAISNFTSVVKLV